MASFEIVSGSGYLDRLRNLYDAPVDTVNGPVSASSLGWRFALSEYGRYMMDNQPYRFVHHFGYDSEHMEQDLGVDVLPLHHQIENAQYVIWILEAEQETKGTMPISDDEVSFAVFTSLIHDMGECTHPEIAKRVGEVVGDIPSGEKTDHNREVETAVRKFLYEELFADVDPIVIARAEAVISHQEESTLHDVVEAAHNLQTFATGVMAGFVAAVWEAENSGARTLNEPLLRSDSEVAQLRRLHSVVVERMTPHIRHWMSRFVYASKFAKMFKGELVVLDVPSVIRTEPKH